MEKKSNYNRNYNRNYDSSYNTNQNMDNRKYSENYDNNTQKNKPNSFSEIKKSNNTTYTGTGKSSNAYRKQQLNRYKNNNNSMDLYGNENQIQVVTAEPTKVLDNVKSKKRAGLKRTMPIDFTLLFAVLTLMLFGVIMIFSASYYTTMTSSKYSYDMFYFLKRQMIWVILGIGTMGFCMSIPYVTWRNFANIIYGISILCQLLLFTPLGIKINGQTRWLGLGETLSFQPSELTKLGVIIFLSHYLTAHRKGMEEFRMFLIPVGFLVFPVALITVSNFSSAILIFLMGATIIFIASPNIKYFIYAGLAAIPLGGFAVTMFSYRMTRITTWLDPWSDPLGDGFQTIQGLLAVASGGFFGLGLGQSRQKSFIPESHNDIIFAIICEELGVIGAAFVIILFGVLIYRGTRIAMNAKDNFGLLTASGITAVIAFQAIINIGVVTNTIPNTGQPLPFISYGGTSLLFLSALVGILLNISKYQRS